MRDLTIPAIPTLYRGVLHRSRLEARWARFWFALGIPEPHYEPQGFVAAGIPYLPDFLVHLALGPLWVEIKPDWETDPEGVEKWRKFAVRRPNPARTRAALFAGPPSLEGAYLIIGGDDDSDNPVQGGWEDDTQQWRPCGSGHHFDLCYPGLFRAKFVEDGCPDDFGGTGEGRLRKAVDAALSERFDGSDNGSAA